MVLPSTKKKEDEETLAFYGFGNKKMFFVYGGRRKTKRESFGRTASMPANAHSRLKTVACKTSVFSVLSRMRRTTLASNLPLAPSCSSPSEGITPLPLVAFHHAMLVSISHVGHFLVYPENVSHRENASVPMFPCVVTRQSQTIGSTPWKKNTAHASRISGRPCHVKATTDCTCNVPVWS